jgi:hypothetical protein
LDNPFGHDNVTAVATDASGNILITGQFTEDLTVGGTALDSAGSIDTYVSKLTSNGDIVWTAHIGGVSTDVPSVIAVDAAGNAYVTGKFGGTADFDGVQLTSHGRSDMFVAAYAAGDGSLLWARRFGEGGTDEGLGLAVTATNELVLAATFQEQIDFGGGSLVSAGSYDIALVCLTTQNGAHRWSSRFGRQAGDQVSGLAVDGQGRAFLAGYFSDQTDLGSGTLVSSGAVDSFVAAFVAQNGQPLWSRRIGGTGFDVSLGVTASPDGKAIVVGYYGYAGGPVDFGGGAIGSVGLADGFIAAYSGADGSHVWSRGVGGPADDNLRSVAADASGGVTVTGDFQIETNLGGALLIGNGAQDVLLARYSSSGDHLWSRSYGGWLGDSGLGVAVDAARDIVVVGKIGYDVNFGGGLLSAQGGYTAPFVAKLTSGEPEPTRTRTPTATWTPPRTPTRTPTSVPAGLSLTGRVTYYNSSGPVPGVTVALLGSQGRTTQTTTNGDYSFANLAPAPLSIEPSKLEDRGDAVSGLDAAYILQAVTGLRQLNGDQLLACDVTGNGDLSSLDAARILQFLVGTEHGFPVTESCASDWLFVPGAAPAANQTLVPPVVASGECRQGSIAFNPLSASAQGQSFKAILFGDCTGNWTAAGGAARQALASNAPQLIAGRPRRTRCGKLAVPIYVRGESFHAVQVTLRYDARSLTPVGARAAARDSRDILVTHSSRRPGLLEIALASARPLRGGRVLYVDLEPAARPEASGAVAIVGGSVDEEAAGLTRTLSRR